MADCCSTVESTSSSSSGKTRAWALAMLIGDAGWAWGLHWGLFGGICFAITANGVDYLFERASLKLFWVNGGYKLVSFAVMGTIIGAGQ